MTIYVRTEAGHSMAYDAKSGLPYKQRVILKMLDSSTHRTVFEDSLQAFGDVRNLFEALEEAGLIKPLLDKAHRPPTVIAAPRNEPSPSALEPHNIPQWYETNVGISELAPVSTLAMDPHMGPATISVAYAGKNRVSDSENATLQRLTKLMDEFVRQHLPEQAPPLLEKLEDMTSLEMFNVSLKGYEQLIKPFGVLAKSHLSQLKKILHDEG